MVRFPDEEFAFANIIILVMSFFLSKSKREEILFPCNFKLGTFRVKDENDNHHTMEERDLIFHILANPLDSIYGALAGRSCYS